MKSVAVGPLSPCWLWMKIVVSKVLPLPTLQRDFCQCRQRLRVVQMFRKSSRIVRASQHLSSGSWGFKGQTSRAALRKLRRLCQVVLNSIGPLFVCREHENPQRTPGYNLACEPLEPCSSVTRGNHSPWVTGSMSKFGRISGLRSFPPSTHEQRR